MASAAVIKGQAAGNLVHGDTHIVHAPIDPGIVLGGIGGIELVTTADLLGPCRDIFLAVKSVSDNCCSFLRRPDQAGASIGTTLMSFLLTNS